ncbi:unnamed protein product, partial [Laminaria digitata]
TRDAQRDIDATRKRREASRAAHVQQGNSGLPKAAPPAYDPTQSTLRLTPTEGGTVKKDTPAGFDATKLTVFLAMKELFPNVPPEHLAKFQAFQEASARRAAYQDGVGPDLNQGPGRWDQAHHYPFAGGEHQGWGYG